MIPRGWKELLSRIAKIEKRCCCSNCLNCEEGTLRLGEGEESIDLSTDGNQLLINGSPLNGEVLVYRAILSQSGTSAPTVDAVLENTLGGTVVWTYSANGYYFGTLAGAFPSNKTWSIVGRAYETVNLNFRCERNSNNAVILSARDAASTPTNTWLRVAIEILVYP